MSEIPSSTWFTVDPHWRWLIVLYFYFGGLAGGCYFLAALTDLLGRPQDRPIARLGYYTVLPCLLISAVLLIIDLSRPERFWHLMLESNTFELMFKAWSPMSVGAWALLLFGFFALISFLAALSEAGHLRWRWPLAWRPPGRAATVFTVVGALFGLFVAGYTGVMVSVTNRPLWSDTPLLGMLLLVSAVSISAAFMLLLARGSRWRLPAVFALRNIDKWTIVLEILVLIAVVVSLGSVARVWLSAWGVLLLFGTVLLGMVVPLLLHRRPDWLGDRTPAIAAVLVLIGGFVLRTVVMVSPAEIAL